MNYKQMLDKIAELEARIQALEQGNKPYNNNFNPPTAPVWVQHQPWPEGWNTTYKGILQ